ncbi:MAG: hypothetical protein FD180_973 [Planctomycetota bacterium]|nr:MAG: hypothetical protein FD180_973 [Planctomycetota bacterium]
MFAGAAREAVFSDATVVERVQKEFVPVALKAGLVNFMSQGAEGRLYAEIGRSKIVPQGICAVNADGRVLAWAIMFEGKGALPEFLDHVLKLNAAHPAGSEPFAAERYGTFPGARVDDVEGRETGPAPKAHGEGERCPALPVVEAGTLVGTVFGRTFKDGKPTGDTSQQERYLESRIEIAPEAQRALAEAADAAGEEEFDVPGFAAFSLCGKAFLGQLDVDPTRCPDGEGSWKLRGRVEEIHGETWVRFQGTSSATASESQVGVGDGRLWSNDVRLTWKGLAKLEGRSVTRLILVAEGREKLTWDHNDRKLDDRSALDHLPAGRGIHLDSDVRFGLVAQTAPADEVGHGPAPNPGRPPQSLLDKMKRLREALDGDQVPLESRRKIGKILDRLEPLLKDRNFEEAEAVLDEALTDAVDSGHNDLSRVKGGVIAFGLRDAKGRLQIFVAKPDGSERRQLTSEGQNGLADWSPDGKRLTFMAIRENGPFIGVMNADGSNQQLIAARGISPDWSPDGRLIAFSRNGQIWTVRADGKEEKQVTSSSTMKVRPSWSPDGKQMVFMLVRNPDPSNPQPQIGIMNSDGTNERILTVEDRTNVDKGGTRVLETAHDTNAPSWSPVDDRVVFWSGIETKYGQVWSIRADGTASTQLTHEPHHANNDDPSWSPDGTKILFSTGRSGRNELWVMDADGKNEMRLFPIDADPFPGRGAWQPVPK